MIKKERKKERKRKRKRRKEKEKEKENHFRRWCHQIQVNIHNENFQKVILLNIVLHLNICLLDNLHLSISIFLYREIKVIFISLCNFIPHWLFAVL